MYKKLLRTLSQGIVAMDDYIWSGRLALVLGFLLVLVVTASGCLSRNDSLPTPVPADETEEQVTPVEPTPTAADAEGEDDSEVSLAPLTEDEQGEVNQCLVCHTDQEKLVDTAAPVVDVESESSGEG